VLGIANASPRKLYALFPADALAVQILPLINVQEMTLLKLSWSGIQVPLTPNLRRLHHLILRFGIP